MDAIFTNLHDPSWWFSAFFIAIIASVIAGFIKDIVERWLVTIFSSLKKRQLEHEENRTAIIEALLNDKVYLEFALFRTLLTAIAFTYLLVQYSSISVDATISHEWLTDAGDLNWKRVNMMLHSLLGSLNIIMGYKMSRRTSIMLDASREYRKRNDLPKLP
jgi:MFS family permease